MTNISFKTHVHVWLKYETLKKRKKKPTESRPVLYLGKYTCSGILPALLNLCMNICINFLWNVQDDPSPLTCSFPPFPSLLSRASHHSAWEWDWFAVSMWEINKCFRCLLRSLRWHRLRRYEVSKPLWQYYQHDDCGFISCEIPWINYCPLFLFLLSAYEYSYDLSFWYLDWVFLQCKTSQKYFCIKGFLSFMAKLMNPLYATACCYMEMKL